MKRIKDSETKTPTVRLKKTAGRKPNKEFLYDIAHNNAEKQGLLKAYALMNFDNDYLLAQSIIPTTRNTVLKQVVQNFQEHSNIPVLLTVQYVMSLIAGYLLEKRVYALKDDVSKVYTNIWAIALAPSGAAKTTSFNIIKKAFGFEPSISSGLESDAMYIEELAEKNYGMLVRDEFGQHLKEVQTGSGPLAKQKDYYLKTYDGDKLERKVKKYTTTVEDPKIVILGMTVDETFYNIMNYETLTDGLAQRFNYTVAQKDPNKDVFEYLDINFKKLGHNLEQMFDEIKNVNLKDEYIIDSTAVEIIRSHFISLFSNFKAIPESFIRRLYWATFKYAMVYHILLCKETELIDSEDLNLAAHFMSIHIRSLKLLLDGIGFQDIEEDIQKIDNAVNKLKSKGEKVEINTVVRYLLRNHKTKYKDVDKTRKMVMSLMV